MNSLYSRLQSEKGKRITQICHFVRSVLLKDFPPEAFLQRPGVVQALLSLLAKKGNKEGESDGDCCAVLECLLELVKVLRGRVRVMLNPLVSGMKDRRSIG